MKTWANDLLLWPHLCHSYYPKALNHGILWFCPNIICNLHTIWKSSFEHELLDSILANLILNHFFFLYYKLLPLNFFGPLHVDRQRHTHKIDVPVTHVLYVQGISTKAGFFNLMLSLLTFGSNIFVWGFPMNYRI